MRESLLEALDDDEAAALLERDYPPTSASFYYYDVSLPDAPVLLHLRAGGAPVTFSGGGPNEEGYQYWTDTFELVDGVVVSESTTQGRDCDGRLDTHMRCVCPVRDLASGTEEQLAYGTIHYPCWQLAERGQRDYTAEAAGF